MSLFTLIEGFMDRRTVIQSLVGGSILISGLRAYEE